MPQINGDDAIDFVTGYRRVVATALRGHAEHLAVAARVARDVYDTIKDDPDKITIQDQTLVTSQGLRQAADVFSHDADQARAALTALDELDGDAER